MRIAMVSEHASPLAVLGGQDAGGQNVHVAALAGALADRGHSVEVYTRREDPDVAGTVPLRPGVGVVHVPAGPARVLAKDELLPHMADFGAWLARRWERSAPDVVHAHFWMSGVATLTATRHVHVPFTQTFHALGVVKRRHQGDLDTSPRHRPAVESWIASRADAVVATCSDEVRELLGCGASPETMHVVPCGVDLSLFHPGAGSTTAAVAGSRTQPHRVLSIGRLVQRKGVETVVTALARLPGTELLVAGGPDGGRVADDPEGRRLLALAREHGVADRVRLLGRVTREQAPALMRSADLVVSVPVYEPFGIVPLEAMACGVPVVTSDVGGMLDTVVDGVTGVRVPAGRPDDLAAAVARLLGDPAARQAMGRAGAEHAARYGWDVVAGMTEDVYEQMLRVRSDGLAEATSRATTSCATTSGRTVA